MVTLGKGAWGRVGFWGCVKGCSSVNIEDSRSTAFGANSRLELARLRGCTRMNMRGLTGGALCLAAMGYGRWLDVLYSVVVRCFRNQLRGCT